jgi:hypothetical protein
MTDTSTLTGTADEQEQVPDIGYSVAELEYLLSIAPGAAADRSANILNVAPVPSVDETILTGGAALLARGELEFLPGGEFKPVDAALVVSYILTNAIRWTVITGATEDSSDLGVFIESPHGGVLAQPRTLGTWWFIILDPAAEPKDIIARSAFGLLEDGPEAAVLVQMMTLTEDRTFSFRREGKDYGYAFAATAAEEPEKLVERADAEQALTELVAFVTDFVGSR